MWNDIKDFVYVGAFLFVATVCLGFGIYGSDFVLYKTFAPMFANAEREVYKNTASYIDGMAHDLSDLQVKYVTCTDPEAKKALATFVLERAAEVDMTKLPSANQKFVDEIKRERGLIK
ncbi:MAG: hypothetical protein WC797_04695 [Candidatus Paceibacterota bacterium]|jgi:hypothetical protein